MFSFNSWSYIKELFEIKKYIRIDEKRNFLFYRNVMVEEAIISQLNNDLFFAMLKSSRKMIILTKMILRTARKILPHKKGKAS